MALVSIRALPPAPARGLAPTPARYSSADDVTYVLGAMNPGAIQNADQWLDGGADPALFFLVLLLQSLEVLADSGL